MDCRDCQRLQKENKLCKDVIVILAIGLIIKALLPDDK